MSNHETNHREYKFRIMDTDGRFLLVKGRPNPKVKLGVSAFYEWGMTSELWFGDKQSARALLKNFPEIARDGGRIVRQVGGTFEPA